MIQLLEEEVRSLVAGEGASFAGVFAPVVMVAGAVALALGRDSRRGIIALWFAQVGAGAVLLHAGAEMLSLAHWAAATLVCAVFFMHADLFEPARPNSEDSARGPKASLIFPALVSVGFAGMVWLLLAQATVSRVGASAPQLGPEPVGGVDESFILLEILALFSLGAAVAGGVISRARRRAS